MDVNLNIEKKEIKYMKELLDGKSDPVELDEIAYRVALFKTQDDRAHKVKIYNPDCEYKVNDLIYKEYPGKIPIGAKKHIEIDEGVVLKVVDVRTRFGIDEIKLSYEGTSEFKKYLAYLDRQKIELLLPHKQEKPPEKPEYLDIEVDPRQKQDPLENRDFCILKRKLAGVLNKENDIAFISDKVLLTQNLKPIGPEVFDKIREFLKENKQSETTEFFVENFVRVKAGDPGFDAFCFSLNYRMWKDYKIDFQQTRKEGWGKWNLISVIYYTKKDSIISEENPLLNSVTLCNKKNITQRRRKFEESVFIEGMSRYYLTQREVYAGAVKLKSGFLDCGDSIEIELVDGKTKKNHLVYYYSDDHLLLGFKELFEKYKALQGMILTFEELEDGRWQFTVRTTKKGTIADKIEYIEEKKTFNISEEKVASPVFVNKAMFLEADIFKTLFAKIDEYRQIETLNKLVHKIFLDFGIKERNYEIHILRLYHILDMVYPIDLKLVEDVILCNNEFIPSDKIAGVFYLDSNEVAAIEEEEYQRKATVKSETKKKRDEVRRKKLDEERQLKDEITRKREERRRKREEEMWQKEKLRKEREEKKNLELRLKKDAESRRKAEAAAGPAPVRRPRRPEREKEKPPLAPYTTETRLHMKKREEDTGKKPDFAGPEPAFPLEQKPPRDVTHKKPKKRPDEEEKPGRSPKRVVKPADDDSMSADEIKSQIQLEELKQKMQEQARSQKKPAKKKKIAYKDDGGGVFGGVFASKLDEIVKKEEDKKKSG